MDTAYQWMNRQIDRLKDNRPPERPRPDVISASGGTVADLVVMSARLNALRPGVAAPDAGFMSGLRACVIAQAREASGSESDDILPPH